MNYMKACLYDAEWQILRVKCLGGWNLNEETVKLNLRQVTEYALNQGLKPEDQEFAVRIWRVLNLLNAVLLAYKQRQIDVMHDAVRHVVQIRDSFSALHRQHFVHSVTMSKGWNWDKVASDLARADKIQLSRLLRNLQHRTKTAVYRGQDPAQTRPELTCFIGLLQAALEPELPGV